MNNPIFTAWKENFVTECFMKHLEEHLRICKESIPTWDSYDNPKHLAANLGKLELLEELINITGEMLEQYESKSD